MWYFAWILGVGLAASFAILNGIWYGLREFDQGKGEPRGK
jgi:cyd operon protein YbgT